VLEVHKQVERKVVCRKLWMIASRDTGEALAERQRSRRLNTGGPD
jgi:hypothetical protein